MSDYMRKKEVRTAGKHGPIKRGEEASTRVISLYSPSVMRENTKTYKKDPSPRERTKPMTKTEPL